MLMKILNSSNLIKISFHDLVLRLINLKANFKNFYSLKIKLNG